MMLRRHPKKPLKQVNNQYFTTHKGYQWTFFDNNFYLLRQLKLKYDEQELESITASIGVSCFPDDGTTSEQLIQVAEKALN